MSKSKEAKFGEYFNLPNPGLESYFDRVRKGNSDEYRTTFFKGKSLSQVLNGWEPQLLSIANKWPSLYAFENDLAKKVGPMSIMKPLKDRLKDIDQYYDAILLESKPLTDSSIAAVLSEWGKHNCGLQLRTQTGTLAKMKLSTNSGSPEFRKRRSVINKTYPVELEIRRPEIVAWLGQNREQWLLCAILGWRGQEGGPSDDDVKQRVVWMFSFGANIRELQFYQMAIEVAQATGFCPAWESMEAVDRRVTKLFDTKGKKDLIVCTDFSKFDQHFNQDMQNAAYKCISKILNSSSESKTWLTEVFPIKYMIPLAIQMDEVMRGPHGMASGSGGTNFDETLTHRALQYEAAQAAHAKLNPNSQCLGDDGMLSYPGIAVEDVTRVYSQHGQEMNPDKQYASAQDCVYLRRWHHENYRVDDVCVGVYSTYRALGRLCEQERFYDPEVWGPKMVALRQLSIIENCKYHPLFEQFVQYCMKGDKYRLGLDIPGFLDNIEQLAKEATDLMPDFLGYTKSLQFENRAVKTHGISEWRVVKYLKSLK
jgi:hypothetical protein